MVEPKRMDLAARTCRLLLCAVVLIPASGLAQTGFVTVDQDTKVSGIDFSGNRVFDDRDLKKQILTDSPGPFRKLAFWSSKKYPFHPVGLQKDVARLRRFYARQGFLRAEIDYVVELDSTENKLDIEFVVEEGEPLILQSVDFIGPDGRSAYYSIAEEEQKSWRNFRRKSGTLRLGRRPSATEVLRLKDETLTWLQNHGYAFSDVALETETDSTANVVDLRFKILPGPRTTISSIQFERLDGETAVSDRTVRRQLPFEVGDWYSHRQTVRGQRSLFALNVFRVVMIDLPEQEQDSTVDVRIRLQQAKLRVVRAQTGYSLDDGVSVEAEFLKRNFLGSARRLTISGLINTGIGERNVDGFVKSLRKRASVSLQQPYFLRKRLSSTLSAFFTRTEDSITQEEEVGGTTSLVYEVLPFRTISAAFSIGRANPIGTASIGESSFTRGIFSVAAVIGKANNYLEPTRGILVRPSLEHGTGLLFSDIKYWKTGINISAYHQVKRYAGIAARLYRGDLWPRGGVSDSEAIELQRFDNVRFYAGGSNDVRGWGPAALGPKSVIQDSTRSPEFRFEPVGALTKLAGNLSYQFPIPGLGTSLQSAIFVDFAKLGSDRLRVGSGAGLRYQTPLGFLRFDVGVKVNPSPEDLRDPEAVFRAGGVEGVPAHEWQRVRFHFGIGNAF
ncbi:MAG TPA: BamA/TamA family outer membrane protein [Rhodothermia bacterium]